MIRFLSVVLLVFIVLLPVTSQVSNGQGVKPALAEAEKDPQLDSCSLVVSADSSEDFFRILYPLGVGDTSQVYVNVAFQIADHNPCYMERKTPLEIRFPKDPFSFKLVAKERGDEFRVVLNVNGGIPEIFLRNLPSFCVLVDEDREYEMDCRKVKY